MSFSRVDILAQGSEEARPFTRKDLLLRALKVERAREIDPKSRQLLNANVVRGLFLHAPGVLLLEGLIAVGAAAVFWRDGFQSIIGAWLALMLATTTVRWLFVVRYFKSDPPPEGARRWARLFAFGAFLSGLFWGIGNIAFYAPDHGILLIVQVFLVTGLCAGALAG